MKKFLFFSLATAALFFTSCTENSLSTTAPVEIAENGISDRSTTVINATINPQGTDLENGIITFTNFDSYPSGLIIAPVQTLEFTDGSGAPVSIQVDVVSFEIIIDDEVMEFSSPGTDFNDFEISSVQSLVFES